MSQEELLTKITHILKANDVSFAALFGSRAKGLDRPNSDIDLLVRFGKPKSLFDVVGVEQALEDATGLEVDLVTERALSPYMKDEVMASLKVIYE